MFNNFFSESNDLSDLAIRDFSVDNGQKVIVSQGSSQRPFYNQDNDPAKPPRVRKQKKRKHDSSFSLDKASNGTLESGIFLSNFHKEVAKISVAAPQPLAQKQRVLSQIFKAQEKSKASIGGTSTKGQSHSNSRKRLKRLQNLSQSIEYNDYYRGDGNWHEPIKQILNSNQLLFLNNNNNNNSTLEKSKRKKKRKMQNKSNLNMSVGAIPVGGNQRSMILQQQGYDVYQNKPIGAKKGSLQVASVNSVSNLGVRTSSLQPVPGSVKQNGQIVLIQKQKKQQQQLTNSMMHVNKSVNLGAPNMILNQSYDGKIAYGPDVSLPQPVGAQSMKQANQAKLQSIYQNHQNGNSSTKANGLNQYQKKMMMKNSNQFRNSYNSVGGVASMVPGQNENVRNSVSSNKIVSNQNGKQNVLMAAYSSGKPKSKDRYQYNYDYGQQPLQTIVPQDIIQLNPGQNNKFHTINESSNYTAQSNKKSQLQDASKRSGTTGGTSGTIGNQNSGLKAQGNIALLNFANQNVYSSNEERQQQQISMAKMDKLRPSQPSENNLYGQNQGVGSRRGLSGGSQGLNNSKSGNSSKTNPQSKANLHQQSMPDIPHKSLSRRSQVSAKGTRLKRGSIKKDHQTLTLMPVDQSLMNNRRVSGTIDPDGEMVVFSPSNMEAPVSLHQAKHKARSGAATQSIDRPTQHLKITQSLARDLEAQLREEVAQLEDEEHLYQQKREQDMKAQDEVDALKLKKAGENVSLKYDINKEKETRNFKLKEQQINHLQENDGKKLLMIASVLNKISQQDKTYMSILGTISESLSSIANQKTIKSQQADLMKGLYTQSQEFQRRYNNVKQRNESSDKVMQEMKKQLICYKEEIENMKKMEAHLTVENYQKLVNDFNQLYDHYKMHKQMSKKLKGELAQSNHRERTFLKLLKKTNEFGEQATQLEQEYDKLYENGDDLSAEQKFIEVQNKIQIPMLDLSIIHIQQQEGDGDTSNSQAQETDQSAANPNDFAQNDISMIEHSESNIDDADLNADQLIFSKNLINSTKMGGILQDNMNPDIPSDSSSKK